jgi:hypothetical protein
MAAARGARRPSSHVLNDEHRRLVAIVVPKANDAEHPARAERDRVAGAPIRHDGFERRRVGGLPSSRSSLMAKAPIPVLLPFVGWEPDGWGESVAVATGRLLTCICVGIDSPR